MNILLVFAYAVSLSMDAFAVSVCKGLSLKRVRTRDAVKVGLYFGIFQGIMPLLGYYFASSFRTYIENFDHWVAFALLAFIGGKMIYESFQNEEECDESGLSFKTMLLLAIATSIDALAVGIAFSIDGMELYSHGFVLGIFMSSLLICATTFVLSFIGVKLGKIFESKLKSRAELAGGIVLVLLGIKILIEHITDFSLFGL